jgi:hypothetical protein
VYRDEAGGFVRDIPEKLLESAVEKAVRSSTTPDSEGT